MDARQVLPLVIAAALVLAPAAAATAAGLPDAKVIPCPANEQEKGTCFVDPETGELVLAVEANSGGSDPETVSDDSGPESTVDNEASSQPKPERPIVDYCRPNDRNGPCGRMDLAEPGTEAVSITDVARYKPAAPTGISQPDGWGLLDRPVNFVVSAEPHIVTGQLLNQPADVRFTPVGFRMETSDGAVIESVTPGDTWEALGQDDFTETPTSHVFTERGTHTITPTVIYIAEYRFAGSDWVTVPSVLPVPGEPRDILIGTIETVLVPNPGER